jgi:serine phosphatase RsbU (regulator of sigma subunit)
LAARYLPGSAGQQVGGDWYDVFELDADHIGVAVGDVLGHDIEAAALMSRVQTALRAYAFVGEQPGAVLDRLDRLMASLQTDRLVTVFYGVLGPATEDGSRQLLFANAGHPPPLLVEADGTARELDDASSLLLGVSSTDYGVRPQHDTALMADSTLLLYTDGLVEVPGKSLTDRVETLLRVVAAEAPRRSPAELCDWLLEALLRGKRRDDVAILVARLVPSAVPEARRHRRLAALRPA